MKAEARERKWPPVYSLIDYIDAAYYSFKRSFDVYDRDIRRSLWVGESISKCDSVRKVPPPSIALIQMNARHSKVQK
jgi:hypothetical protein